MDIEARLRAFAAVAREGSFSRAAERLYVSQPAVSKHVASLEAELGTQLIIRDRRGATLTPAGQVLADYVLRAEALLANARRALATGAEAQIGTLSLAASGIPGTYLLPAPLARFHDERPAVELDVRLSTSGGSLELVRSHDVELAVGRGRRRARRGSVARWTKVAAEGSRGVDLGLARGRVGDPGCS
jgi:DNA-binding transcriptional LysR family regulator